MLGSQGLSARGTLPSGADFQDLRRQAAIVALFVRFFDKFCLSEPIYLVWLK